MGLLEEARAIQDGKAKRGVCSVAVLLETLPPADAADLRALIDDQSYDAMTITRVLVNHGHSMHSKRMQNHRAIPKRCACGR